jgi:outer membrane immunogenic protein
VLQMKKFLVAGIAAAAFCGVPVLAADLPVKAPPVAPMFNWSGFYFGGHAGYGWGQSDWTWVPPGGARNVSADPSGFWGGAQAGWQQQWNNVVAGIELTWSGGDLNDAKLQNLFGPPVHSIQTRIGSLITGTARLGVANNNALYYAKGGFASAEVARSEAWTGGGLETQTRQRVNGWTVGAGFEYLLGSNWIAGLEYDYISLNPSNRFNVQVPPFAENDYLNAHLNVHTIVARLSYKFGDP